MFYEKLRKERLLWKTEIIRSFSRIRIRRRSGMWDPCDLEESVRKAKDLKSDVKALLLIRFQILYFSQIPGRNKDPTSQISVPFYAGTSEYFPVFLNLSSFRQIRIYCTDRLVYPIRLSSISFAASRPSRIAHTTSDCPLCISPAVNTFGTLDA